MPKLDLEKIEQTNATGYPAPFDVQVAGRRYRRLAPISGLTRFGASHVILEPGAWSSQRHWHDGEDELVIMLAGEAVLVDDDGEHLMFPGDIAAFPAGEKNGHHLQNRSETECVFIAIGAGERSAGGSYSDIDMVSRGDGYFTKAGERYDTVRLT